MRKDFLTLTFVPLLLVSCSCSHKSPSDAASSQATPASHAAAATDQASLASANSEAAPTGPLATPDQVLHLTLLDQSSSAPVYHAGLNLLGSKHLQWTDKQGHSQWAGGGFAATGAIEIRCPALRAEAGRKIATLPYALKGPLTEVGTTIDTSVCVEPPEKTVTGSASGTFYSYYGHGVFIPCGGLPANASFYGNAKDAWVTFGGSTAGDFDKLREAASVAASQDTPTYVEWTGDLTGPGGYGELGAFAYKFNVAEVKTVSGDFPTGCPASKVE